MIEHTTINGKKATIAYLSYDFEPMDKATAPMAKIIEDGGRVLFIKRAVGPESAKMWGRIAKLRSEIARRKKR